MDGSICAFGGDCPPAPRGDGRGEVLLSQEDLGGCGGGLLWERGFRKWELKLCLEFPDKAAEFAGNGDDAFAIAQASGSETCVSFGKALLHAPGEGFDLVGLTFLSFGEGCADFWGASVSLGRFAEHPAGVAVTAFGDGSLTPFVATGFFTGDESKEGHELAGALKTTKVTEFADDGHGGDFLESFAGHEGFDNGFPFPVVEDLFHFVFEELDLFQAGVDGLKVAFEDDGLSGIR